MALVRRGALMGASRAFFTASPHLPGPSDTKPFFRSDAAKQTAERSEREREREEREKRNERETKDTEPTGKDHAAPLFSPSALFAKHAPRHATHFAASIVKEVLRPHTNHDNHMNKNIHQDMNPNINKSSEGNEKESGGGCAKVDAAENRQMYSERCILGWSPRELYRVVADVSQYSLFLPWCMDSIVHDIKQIDSSASQESLAMIASLTVGFAFYKEKYTSDVLLVPENKVRATLHEQSKRKAPVLKDLFCEWEFFPVQENKRSVEVRFLVSFAFRNPLHSKLIMSNIVSLMTNSFEKRCENLYGPPSCHRKQLGD